MLRHVTWTYGHDDDVLAITRLECGLRLPARQARLMPAYLLQVVANTDPRRTSRHDKWPKRPGSAGVAAGKLMPFTPVPVVGEPASGRLGSGTRTAWAQVLSLRG